MTIITKLVVKESKEEVIRCDSCNREDLHALSYHSTDEQQRPLIKFLNNSHTLEHVCSTCWRGDLSGFKVTWAPLVLSNDEARTRLIIEPDFLTKLWEVVNGAVHTKMGVK